MASATDHGDLPEDVILDILLRLPVKTLLQCKSVCKLWYTVISSPCFVTRHFAHESNPERLLVRHCKPDNEYGFALYKDEKFCEYEAPDYLQMPVTVGALLGPLNGIFCVVSLWGQIALLNPATRQFRPLPLVAPEVQPYLTTYEDLLGFGIDPLSGDYKLVSLRYFWNEELDVPHHPCLVSVYSSGSDSWRHFEDVELVNSSRSAYKSLCNTYSNGVYYWLTEFNESDVAILAFDMSSERFREIQRPDCVNSREGELGLFGDSIALLSCDLDKIDKCVDVWVMKTEGCWVKTLSIGPFPDIRWPLGFWKDSELLLETGNLFLGLYNVSSRKLRAVAAQRKENGFFIYWVFSYKESLVSIKGEGCVCGQWDASSEFVKDFFRKPLGNR